VAFSYRRQSAFDQKRHIIIPKVFQILAQAARKKTTGLTRDDGIEILDHIGY
jgi:hypothetical protein